MNDIGSFASPTPFDDATGALFAWADDRIADNEVWSAQGIVAVPFVHHGDVQRDAPYVSTLTLAPYANFDRVANSKKSDEDVDNLTYGAVFELGCANVMLATQDLRASSEVVSSFDGDAKNWSAAFTWQPIGDVNPEGPNSIFSYMGTPLPFGRNFLLTSAPRSTWTTPTICRTRAPNPSSPSMTRLFVPDRPSRSLSTARRESSCRGGSSAYITRSVMAGSMTRYRPGSASCSTQP
jgi:hypothetical protein